MKWSIGGRITGSVYIGEVEAETEEEAIEKGWELYHDGKWDKDSVEWDVNEVDADPAR